MVDEILGTVLRAVAWLARELVIDLLLEVVVRGSGSLFLKYVIFLGRRDVDPRGGPATGTGVLLVVAVLAGLFLAFAA